MLEGLGLIAMAEAVWKSEKRARKDGNWEESSMAEHWENPIGLDGIEFVEFAAPNPKVLHELFVRVGFTKVAKHKKKKVHLYRQNRVNFVINEEPQTFAAAFSRTHGSSICATGFRVKDASFALEETKRRGAEVIPTQSEPQSHSFPAIFGIGGSAIYFVDQHEHFDEDFEFLSDEKYPRGYGLEVIDHLTNNVPKNEMSKWCEFYENLFNFKDVRQFDIKGQKTGLVSKVMKSPCGKIIIPINEPTEAKSQIQEYLDEYKGPGIQHLALLTNDIIQSVESLRESKIEFLDTPDTYYELLPQRLESVTESMGTLRDLRILADGDEDGYLLQIFTQNLIGPIFFEIIQRKNHDGFGEGNFQALFDAIERDQAKRGYL